jgi:hypothetical protein
MWFSPIFSVSAPRRQASAADLEFLHRRRKFVQELQIEKRH